jgi:hypothetical protein
MPADIIPLKKAADEPKPKPPEAAQQLLQQALDTGVRGELRTDHVVRRHRQGGKLEVRHERNASLPRNRVPIYCALCGGCFSV